MIVHDASISAPQLATSGRIQKQQVIDYPVLCGSIAGQPGKGKHSVSSDLRIAVVIPCYRETRHILSVIANLPACVSEIYCVDDACPDGTGDLVEKKCGDPRVTVIRNTRNLGVGGAMVTGYRAALDGQCDVVVKMDGDGQMSGALIERFVEPIANGMADYTKGNRFFQVEGVEAMPAVRIVGNAILSFLSKLSTGYWQIFDANNGFTAIHSRVLALLPLDRIHRGYFFEPDMLFRLNTLRAIVLDIPMPAVYGDETSHVVVHRDLPIFAIGHLRNFFKRIFYNYFLRNFHIASIECVVGPLLMLFGIVFGTTTWIGNVQAGVETSAGTVMLAALPLVLGLQLTLSALHFDMTNRPSVALHRLLPPD